MDAGNDSDAQRPSSPLQFSMRDLLLATVIACMMAVTFAGLTRRDSNWPIYVLLACVAPLILVTVAGLLHLGSWTIARLRKRRK